MLAPLNIYHVVNVLRGISYRFHYPRYCGRLPTAAQVFVTTEYGGKLAVSCVLYLHVASCQRSFLSWGSNSQQVSLSFTHFVTDRFISLFVLTLTVLTSPHIKFVLFSFRGLYQSCDNYLAWSPPLLLSILIFIFLAFSFFHRKSKVLKASRLASGKPPAVRSCQRRTKNEIQDRCA